MTLPSVIRIFFAIDLPQATKEKIGKFIMELKNKAKSQAIRWTKPDNLHITLQFIAQLQTKDLSTLIAKVKKKVSNHINGSLELGELQLFPHPYRPRVIVLEVKPQVDLSTLANLISEELQALHYAVETRPFRAHLTLGRIKHPQGVSLNFLSGSKVPVIEKIAVREVNLFLSEPQPNGSRYISLEKIALANINMRKNVC